MQDKLISADKLLEWGKVALGSAKLWNELNAEIESGRVDPTPPVQPDIKVGDKVRHKQYKSYGEGVVGEISGSGKSAWVRPWSAYYRLDKLEVITDEQR